MRRQGQEMDGSFCFSYQTVLGLFSGSIWTLNPAGCRADVVGWVKNCLGFPACLSLSLSPASVHKASAKFLSSGFVF